MLRKINSHQSDINASDTDEPTMEDKSYEEKKKEPVTLKKFFTRFLFASLLGTLFVALLMAGHLYCILGAVITQFELYREIVNIRYVEAKERSMPWFRTLQWAWFIVPMCYVYGETFHKFCIEHRQLTTFTQYTEMIPHFVFIMYWVLFITSVLTLKPGLIRFQISQFMWSIVTVCLVVFQCKFLASNTLNGLFWYFYPMATVIMNDVSAYIFGITLGRKFIKAPFLALSPNKTWEGFIGAAVATLIFSFFFPAILVQFSWFICPAEKLYLIPFPPSLTCEPNPVFIKTLINIPMIGPMMLYPIQIHGLAYGLFASIVAPFGGFFASAMKRAYQKKDFDSFIPGHGGMMDRMDCQLLMASFTAFYYFAFIRPRAYGLSRMMYLISQMTPEMQEVLWLELGRKIHPEG